jgi:ferredoxin-NADP reductase
LTGPAVSRLGASNYPCRAIACYSKDNAFILVFKVTSDLARQLYTARLTKKFLLSERAQCFHLEFTVDELERFDFAAGQFVSTVATDTKGKQQTRAYSVASAARSNQFDLCLNRVEGGFFSNLLCDLEVGQTVQFHGPHGLFILRRPLTDGVFIATGTGVAPMRSFVQMLFPETGEDLSEGRKFWLVYGTRHETEIYYKEFFEKIAASHPNFHYLTTLSRPQDGWLGARGYVQDIVAKIAEEHAHKRSKESCPFTSPEGFGVHAYICGLNDMVSATRERLMGLGWQKKQVIFERYD